MFVRSPRKHQVKVIEESASLLCATLQYVTRDKEKVFEDTFSEIYKNVKDWIIHSNVIGGNAFGGGIKYYDTLNKKHEEIEVWFT